MNQIKAGRQWIPNRTSFAIEQAAVASSSANAANVERQLASDKIPHGPSSSAQRHDTRCYRCLEHCFLIADLSSRAIDARGAFLGCLSLTTSTEPRVRMKRPRA